MWVTENEDIRNQIIEKDLRIYLVCNKATSSRSVWTGYIILENRMVRIANEIKVGGYGTAHNFLAFQEIAKEIGLNTLHQNYKVL